METLDPRSATPLQAELLLEVAPGHALTVVFGQCPAGLLEVMQVLELFEELEVFGGDDSGNALAAADQHEPLMPRNAIEDGREFLTIIRQGDSYIGHWPSGVTL